MIFIVFMIILQKKNNEKNQKNNNKNNDYLLKEHFIIYYNSQDRFLNNYFLKQSKDNTSLVQSIENFKLHDIKSKRILPNNNVVINLRCKL